MWERFSRYSSEKYPILSKHLNNASSYAIFGPNALVIRFPSSYTNARRECESEASLLRFQDALKRVTGQPISVRVEIDRNPNAQPLGGTQALAQAPTERKRSLASLPMFKKASDALGAQIWHVDDDFDPSAPPKAVARKDGDADETETEEG